MKQFSTVILAFLSVNALVFCTAEEDSSHSRDSMGMLLHREMFFGSDHFFGGLQDLSYADTVDPSGTEEDTPVVVTVASATREKKKSSSTSSSSASSSGSGSTSTGEPDPDIEPPVVEPPVVEPPVIEPPDPGG